MSASGLKKIAAGLAPACLPDSDPLLGGDRQGLILRNIEGFVPGVHVADDSVDPVLTGTVGVDDQASAEFRFAVQPSPDLGPTEKETLVAAEPVDFRRRPTFQ